MATKKILIVDDEKELLRALEIRFRAAGYEVIVARDGHEGINKVRTDSPDLIILDVMMPRMDGYQMCRLLKFDEKHKDIPVIMLTAKSQEIDKVTAKKTGADAYITKPFADEELLGKVKELL